MTVVIVLHLARIWLGHIAHWQRSCRGRDLYDLVDLVRGSSTEKLVATRRGTRVPVRPARRLICRSADVRTSGSQLTAERRGQGSRSQAGLDAVTRLGDSNG
jgi:hypothetical protein